MLAILAGLLTTGCSSDAASTARPTDREISTLLARHGRAVLAHDRKTFLSDLAPAASARAFRKAQGDAFDNLATLPVTHWTYTIGPRVEDAQAQSAARRSRS